MEALLQGRDNRVFERTKITLSEESNHWNWIGRSWALCTEKRLFIHSFTHTFVQEIFLECFLCSLRRKGLRGKTERTALFRDPNSCTLDCSLPCPSSKSGTLKRMVFLAWLKKNGAPEVHWLRIDSWSFEWCYQRAEALRIIGAQEQVRAIVLTGLNKVLSVWKSSAVDVALTEKPWRGR